ncbi:hypothetical protein [Methylobacterium pseudosasicola]|uniref:Uncharacterized protein n=1 Tax=Methylobacterium pseudosasicola TaxID=582667 RepID=A0A1I4VN07_9HYPH|nr:hypothetical protein [Methylobacterium pseudosasicola]SFN02465.1 hypothetical protein SAMN05192568_11104 [Methylobacterium pseudosasicola]
MKLLDKVLLGAMFLFVAIYLWFMLKVIWFFLQLLPISLFLFAF